MATTAPCDLLVARTHKVAQTLATEARYHNCNDWRCAYGWGQEVSSLCSTYAIVRQACDSGLHSLLVLAVGEVFRRLRQHNGEANIKGLVVQLEANNPAWRELVVEALNTLPLTPAHSA